MKKVSREENGEGMQVSFVLAFFAHLHLWAELSFSPRQIYAIGDALARPCPHAHQLTTVLCARLFLSHNHPQGWKKPTCPLAVRKQILALLMWPEHSELFCLLGKIVWSFCSYPEHLRYVATSPWDWEGTKEFPSPGISGDLSACTCQASAAVIAFTICHCVGYLLFPGHMSSLSTHPLPGQGVPHLLVVNGHHCWLKSTASSRWALSCCLGHQSCATCFSPGDRSQGVRHIEPTCVIPLSVGRDTGHVLGGCGRSTSPWPAPRSCGQSSGTRTGGPPDCPAAEKDIATDKVCSVFRMKPMQSYLAAPEMGSALWLGMVQSVK